jgi:hypothetical protein
LLGQLAGLERNLVPPDLYGDPAYITIHSVPFGRLRLAAACVSTFEKSRAQTSSGCRQAATREVRARRR